MEELTAQVGPVAELAEEAQRCEQTAQILSVQRDRMFQALVERAKAVALSLGVDALVVPAEGNHDAAAYLTFFDQLLNRLEGALAEFEGLINEVNHNMLAVAVERLFSNLRQLQPHTVNSYVDRFKRSTAEETSEEEGEKEDEDAGGDASA